VIALDPARSPLSIGRLPTNDISLAWDREVSRVHARLEHDSGGWVLVDDGLSRNGSFVDGVLVRRRRRLQDAQILRLGATVLLYRTTGVPEARRPDPTYGVTLDAPMRLATQLVPGDLDLLTALAAGQRRQGVEDLWRRLGVEDLPEPERVATALRLARAIGAIDG